MAGKASLFDIKNTMAEIAANIESKVGVEEHKRVVEEMRVERSELVGRIGEKVSFEDMKRYVALSKSDGATGVGGDGVTG